MRSLLRVGIRPLKNSRISFSVQLALVFFWLAYGTALLFTENPANDRSYLHIVFLEITPAYIVQKKGHFRPKLVIAFEEVASLQMAPHLLHFTMKDGEKITMDTRSIKRKKNIALVKENLEKMAERHRFEFIDNTAN